MVTEKYKNNLVRAVNNLAAKIDKAEELRGFVLTNMELPVEQESQRLAIAGKADHKSGQELVIMGNGELEVWKADASSSKGKKKLSEQLYEYANGVSVNDTERGLIESFTNLAAAVRVVKDTLYEENSHTGHQLAESITGSYHEVLMQLSSQQQIKQASHRNLQLTYGGICLGISAMSINSPDFTHIVGLLSFAYAAVGGFTAMICTESQRDLGSDVAKLVGDEWAQELLSPASIA